MKTATAPGSYKGRLESLGLAKSKNGFVELQVSGTWTQFKAEGAKKFEDLPEPEGLAGYFYLTNKNGRSAVVIDSLKKAFRMPKSLPSSKFLLELKSMQAAEGEAFWEREYTCKAELESNDEGEEQLRMKWLNPVGGGFKMPEGKEFDDLEAEFERASEGKAPAAYDTLPSTAKNDTFTAADDEEF